MSIKQRNKTELRLIGHVMLRFLLHIVLGHTDWNTYHPLSLTEELSEALGKNLTESKILFLFFQVNVTALRTVSHYQPLLIDIIWPTLPREL